MTRVSGDERETESDEGIKIKWGKTVTCCKQTLHTQ
jgi:hypothetical protein